jgi:hypothetical protein
VVLEQWLSGGLSWQEQSGRGAGSLSSHHGFHVTLGPFVHRVRRPKQRDLPREAAQEARCGAGHHHQL